MARRRKWRKERRHGKKRYQRKKYNRHKSHVRRLTRQEKKRNCSSRDSRTGSERNGRACRVSPVRPYGREGFRAGGNVEVIRILGANIGFVLRFALDGARRNRRR